MTRIIFVNFQIIEIALKVDRVLSLGMTIHISGSCSCCVKVWVFYYTTQSKLNTNNNRIKNISLNTT